MSKVTFLMAVKNFVNHFIHNLTSNRMISEFLIMIACLSFNDRAYQPV